MNKFSLRFQNKVLEQMYRNQSTHAITRFFVFIQLSFIFGSSLVLIQSLMVLKDLQLFIEFAVFIVFCFISIYIGVYKFTSRIPQILFLQNLFIGSLQLDYVIQLHLDDENLAILTQSHQAFLFGVFLTMLHISLIVGPDFVENLLQIAILFSMKTIIGLQKSSSLFAIFLPVGTCYLIYSVYLKEQICRENFIRKQLDLHQDILMDRASSDYYLMVEVDNKEQKIKPIRSNTQLKTHFLISKDSDVVLLLRQLIVQSPRKITLEQYLWARRKDIQSHFTEMLADAGTVQCSMTTATKRLHYEVRIFINCVGDPKFNLYFINKTMELEQSTRINHVIMLKQSLFKAFRKQNALHKDILTKIESLRNTSPIRSQLQSINHIRRQVLFCTNTLYQIQMSTDHYHKFASLKMKDIFRLLKKVTMICEKGPQEFILCNQTNLSQTLTTSASLLVHLHVSIIKFMQCRKLGKKMIKFSVCTNSYKRALVIEYRFSCKGVQIIDKHIMELQSFVKNILRVIGVESYLNISQIEKGYLIVARIIDRTIIESKYDKFGL